MRILSLLAALLLLASCGRSRAEPGSPRTSEPAVDAPSLGEEFAVERGKTVTLASGEPAVVFTGLARDSRCPPGQQCVWEGDAEVELTVGGEAVVVHTNSQFATSGQAGGYTVELVRLDVPGTIATLVVTGA